MSDPIRIGVSEKNHDPYWDVLNRGFEDAAERLGVLIDIRAPRTEDGTAQLRQIGELLADGVDALAVVASDTDLLSPAIARTVATGVPVVCFDLDAPDSRRFAHVGTLDFPDLGRAAATALASILPPSSEVLVQVGSRHAHGALGKAEGFRSEIEHLGHRVAEVTFDAHDEREAEEQAAEALSRNPNIAGLFGVYGYHPGAQARASRHLPTGRRPRIVGFDLLPATLAGLEDGTIDASIWLQEYYFGYLTTALLHNMVTLGVAETALLCGFTQEEPARNRLTIEPILVTRDELDGLRPRLRQLGVIT